MTHCNGRAIAPEVEIRWSILLLCLSVLTCGCASAHPASTDLHNRVPQVNCTAVRLGTTDQMYCCEGNSCVLVN